MSAPAAQEADTAELSKLCLRLDRVLGRLEALEHWAGITPLEALRWRQVALLDRICELEAAFGIAAKPLSASVPGPKPALLSRAVAPAATAVAAQPPPPPPAAATAAPPMPAVTAVDVSGSAVQQRLQAELLERRLVHHRFVRAPGEYYDRPLEFRRGVRGGGAL